MRLLRWTSANQVNLTRDLNDDERPPYAILSHTWAHDNSEEVAFAEVETEEGQKKIGYEKIRFCAEQARKDGIDHFWVDTCCIDKTNHVELSEAITSMFRWYQNAIKCYAYLPDVLDRNYNQDNDDNDDATQSAWESSFRSSRWFKRGWTLQELLAPKTVEFYSRDRAYLGDKGTLAQQIHKITSIPVQVLRGTTFSQFSIVERMRWAETRQTKKPEDRAYCLLGIFDISIPIIYGEGERKAFRRLQREIQEQAGAAAPSAHTHWMVPRIANPLFTGRQDLLQELESIIRDAVQCPWDRAQCRVVVTGMGGQGKSEICLQLARRLRQTFWAVLWIDISTKDIAERSFIEAAQRLCISAQDWQEAIYSIANLQQPWLLVLDNADDPEIDYQEFFPESRHGVILMTSRNQECEHYSTDQTVALEGLDINEAQDLLLKAVRVPPSQHSKYAADAQQVATLLQSHPLALIQAGAYVARGHCTLVDYPNVYNRQRQRLLTFRPAQARSRYCDVYATFEVSAEMLEAMNTSASRDALQLLPLLAVCGHSHFPVFLFEAGWQGAQKVSPDLDDDAEDEEVLLLTPWHVARLPAVCDAPCEMWDSYRLVEAIGLLKAFSLVTAGARGGSIHVSLHALIHAWARDRQNQLQQQQAWLQMGCLTALALSHRNLTNDQMSWLQPHVEALVGWSTREIFSTGPKILVARILTRCGWYLLNQRADAKLFTLLHKTLGGLKLDIHKVEQRWIGLFYLVALSFSSHGRVKEAIALLENVVKIRKQTLAENHLDRLASHHALAEAYEANGQIKEAIVLLEDVVKIGKRTLAEDDLDRLASQHALAIAYRGNGQVKEAITLLENVIRIEKQTLAEDHPDRLASQHTLAGAYRANGQVKEAVALLEEVVKIRKQILVEDHPDRLASQHALAIAYRANGQIKEAIVLLEEVVNVEKQTLVETHPSRLASQYALAIVYQANEQVDEAVPLLEEVVRIRKQTLAEDHPLRLASQHNLAIYLWNTERRGASLELMAQIVEVQRRTQEEHHPDLQVSEWWLAYFKQNINNAHNQLSDTHSL